MLDLKRVRPLDAAIAVALVIVIGLGAYLGVVYFMNRRATVNATPAARAVEELSAKVRQQPNNINLRMELAQALSVAARDRQAIEQYKAALQLQKDYAPALSGLGFIALKQKQYKEAEGYYRKIIDQLSGNVPVGGEGTLEIAYYYLGTALAEQKKHEEAAANFKEAIRLRRDASDTHYALAMSLKELGLMDAYEESLGNALLFDPMMPEPNYFYGLLMLEQGDEAAAAEHFRRSTDGAPTKDEPREALEALGPVEKRRAAAKALAATDEKKALNEARIAVALEPEDVPTILLMADLYEKTGNNDLAQTAYQKVLTLEPGNAAATAGLERVKNGS